MMIAAGWPDVKGAAAKVAQANGLHQNTITRWAKSESNPPPAKIVRRKKDDMSATINEMMWDILLELGERVENAKTNELFTGFGILFDKNRLLNGESTDNQAVQINVIRVNRGDGN